MFTKLKTVVHYVTWTLDQIWVIFCLCCVQQALNIEFLSKLVEWHLKQIEDWIAQGLGKNKKAAKRLAAENMLSMLQEKEKLRVSG